MPSYLSSDNWSKPSETAHDPVWDQVDQYTIEHLHPESRPNSAALIATLKHSLASGLPDISVNPSMGKYLAIQCRVLGAKQAIEVGTLGGYSAIWLASMNPELQITSLEFNPHHVKVARENIENAGYSSQITVVEGAALDSLQHIEKEVQDGQRPRIDYMFIDADKQNNWPYFDYGVRMARPGALIYVDNIVRQGRLVKEVSLPADMGARQVVENVGKDSRVEAIVMQTVAEKCYDGFLAAVVL